MPTFTRCVLTISSPPGYLLLVINGAYQTKLIFDLADAVSYFQNVG